MAGLNGQEVRVAGSGNLWLGTSQSKLPTDMTTALDATWRNLGYAKSGFQFKQDLHTQGVNTWQSLQYIRILNQGLYYSFSFELQQTNPSVLALAFGGAITESSGTGGQYTITMPDPSQIPEFPLVLDWRDGQVQQRFVIKRGSFTSLPTITYDRQNEVSYPIEIAALAPADGSNPLAIYGVDINMTNDLAAANAAAATTPVTTGV